MTLNVVQLPAAVRAGNRQRQVLAAQPINPDAMYRVKECLALAGICNTTFYKMVRTGKGPTIRKVGRGTRVLGRDFIAWRDSLAGKSAA